MTSNTARGELRKMRATAASPVRYELVLAGKTPTATPLNPLIGATITLSYTGTIRCIACGRKTSKSFAQGFCYRCFRDAPAASPCIIRPELCEGHLGRGRDVAWEREHHVQPHIVYLAWTSGLKVGVTLASNLPTRWIDQGASRAIRLAETPHRQIAGQIEVALKEHVSDRTAWQQMLESSGAPEVDLVADKERLSELLPAELEEYCSSDDDVVELDYPQSTATTKPPQQGVLAGIVELDEPTPTKVKSFTLDSKPQHQGVLAGIRGQYLLFEGGRVLNVRRHGGYEVELSWSKD